MRQEALSHAARSHIIGTIQPKGNHRRLALVYEGVAYGGTEEYILLILRYLDQARFAPVIVISGFNFQFAPAKFIERVRALGVPVIYTAEGETRQRSVIRDVTNLVHVFRKLETDVAHIHSQRPDGGRRATLAARLAGVRTVVRSEHLPPSSNLSATTRFMITPLDWMTDYIIAGSDSCLVEHFALLRRNQRKTLRLYYGIELDRFDPNHDVAAAKQRLGLDPGIPTIGKIAPLSPEKDHATLIGAAAQVIAAFGPVNFLLVGNGSLEAELRARVAAAGIDAYVHFPGFASDTVPFIQAMDITTMSSISEGISLAMLEYMAMAKPVIATNEPSFTETVVHGESGLIVARQDPTALAHAIVQLLHNPGMAAQLAHQAHQRVHTLFDIRANVQQLMQLYAGHVPPPIPALA